ncbi:4268_t:CDS:1, partial [Entrophospora sp. SA101]
ENEISVNENSSNLSETSRYSSNFFESIFDNEEHDEISEVDKYLDLRLTPLAHQSENPWA